jgi:hypothetical protein
VHSQLTFVEQVIFQNCLAAPGAVRRSKRCGSAPGDHASWARDSVPGLWRVTRTRVPARAESVDYEALPWLLPLAGRTATITSRATAGAAPRRTLLPHAKAVSRPEDRGLAGLAVDACRPPVASKDDHAATARPAYLHVAMSGLFPLRTAFATEADECFDSAHAEESSQGSRCQDIVGLVERCWPGVLQERGIR